MSNGIIQPMSVFPWRTFDFQHFENVEALPEQEQSDQHQTVVEIQSAFARQRPDRSREKQNRPPASSAARAG